MLWAAWCSMFLAGLHGIDIHLPTKTGASATTRTRSVWRLGTQAHGTRERERDYPLDIVCCYVFIYLFSLPGVYKLI